MTAAVSDLRAVLGGSLAGNRLRAAVAVLAIALGVALAFAIHLINRSALDELTASVRTLSGDADLSVRGPRSGFSESIYPVLARHADVAVASPVVEIDVRAAGSEETLRVLGIDPFAAGSIQPALVAQVGTPLDLLQPDTVALSASAMRLLDAALGDRVTLHAGLRDVSLRVAGTLDMAGAQRLAVMDIAGAQAAFGRIGLLSRIDVRLRPGVASAAFARSIAGALPPGVVVDRPDATLRATESISRSYRVNLNVLALVALFTGGLLVFTTQVLAVMRRRTQFALLRTLGMTRGRLVRMCLIEGAIVGATGSVIGVAAGHVIAFVAVRVAGGDLGSGYFRGVEATIDPDPAAMLVFVALGTIVAVVGSVVPAREAGHAAPASALKAGDEERPLVKLRAPWPGLGVLLLAALLVGLPAAGGLPLAGYASIACLLIGTLLLMPWVLGAVIARLPLPTHAPAALGLLHLRGAPGQVAVSLASIVASVSLMVSMAIMVHSLRHSLDAWLTRVLPADLYVRVASPDSGLLTPDDQAQIAAVPGVARIEFVREEQLLLDASRPRVVLLARPLSERDAAASLPLVSAPVQRKPDAPPPAWVNEAMVDLYGFAPGQVVTLPLAGRDEQFFVAGVWRDYGRPQGAIQIERDRYVEITGDRGATGAALWRVPDADASAIQETIRQQVPGGERLEMRAPGEIRALSMQAFDRTFAVTYALEIAAVAIGLVGLSSAFGARVLARRREFGVLRHLGMTRRQVASMLATEGSLTAVLGVTVGLVLGAVISLVLVYVVGRQSFHWGMELSLPWLELAAFTFVVILLATLTAVASGRQAMQLDVVRAVKDDW